MWWWLLVVVVGCWVVVGWLLLLLLIASFWLQVACCKLLVAGCCCCVVVVVCCWLLLLLCLFVGYLLFTRCLLVFQLLLPAPRPCCFHVFENGASCVQLHSPDVRTSPADEQPDRCAQRNFGRRAEVYRHWFLQPRLH